MRRVPKRGVVAGALLLGVGLLGYAWVKAPVRIPVAWMPQSWLIARWRTASALANEDDAAALVWQFPKLGHVAIPILVDQLCDPRPRVRQSAEAVVRNEVNRWSTLPLNAASRNVESLVARLRQQVDRLDPSEREFIESIVMRLVVWPLDSDAVDTPQILEDCEVVLGTLYRRSTESHSTRGRATSGASIDASFPDRPGETVDRGEPPAESSATLDDVSGPRPAIGSHSSIGDMTDSGGPLEPSPSPTDAERGVPGSFDGSDTARRALPPRTSPAGGRFSLSDADDAAENDGPVELGDGPVQDTRSGPSHAAPSASWLRDATDEGVVERLADIEASIAIAAARELHARGYSPSTIRAMERLVDSDPATRADGLKELVLHSEFNAAEWILRMSLDSDANVRRVVVGFLAGGNDPRFARRIREMASSERDPEVLQALRTATGIRRRE